MVTRLRAQLGQHEFALRTTLTPADIIRSADRAEHAAQQAGRSVRRAATRPDGIAYRVTGGGGLVQLTFALTWSSALDGTREVRLRVHDFLGARARRSYWPVGPLAAPGMPALAHFSERVREELVRAGLGVREEGRRRA